MQYSPWAWAGAMFTTGMMHIERMGKNHHRQEMQRNILRTSDWQHYQLMIKRTKKKCPQKREI